MKASGVDTPPGAFAFDKHACVPARRKKFRNVCSFFRLLERTNTRAAWSPMHKLFLAGGLLLTTTTAYADPYRWCAELGGGGEASFTNCYFVTRAQCEATVAGVGGFCRQNMLFDG